MRHVKHHVPVLMYHIIGDDSAPPDVYTVRTDAFEEHLKYFRDAGIRILSISDLVSDRGGSGPAAVITFDDGHVSNYTHAFPRLREYGFTAAFFVTVGSIGTPGFMSWDQLREMTGAGMIIGSHTLTHPILIRMSDPEIRFEMEESKKRLESELHIPAVFFSNPHIFTSERIQRIALETGYRAVCISRAGYYPAGSGNNIINRLNVRANYRVQDVMRIVSGSPLILLRIRLQQAASSLVRSIVGVKRYETLKRMVLPLLGKH